MTVNYINNLIRVKDKIAQAAISAGRKPEDITLVAVSKYAGLDAVNTLAASGQLDFGENRIQDGLEKLQANPNLRWHLIGRIQTNKVKYISPFYLIHSLDRWDLAEMMAEFAGKKKVEFQCLLQVNVAADPAKAGVRVEEAEDFLARVSLLSGLRVRGLMTITALDAGRAETQAWFETMASLFNYLKGRMLPGNVSMDWLSMGMSDDYEMAIAAGSNLVRVGSAIFNAEGE